MKPQQNEPQPPYQFQPQCGHPQWWWHGSHQQFHEELKQELLDTLPTAPDDIGAFVRGCSRGESERGTRRGLFEIAVSDGATFEVPVAAFEDATAPLRPFWLPVSRGE